uniref:Retrotransposon protein, putative, Ty3-gypsy subclass n=1 Tax=Oryza sativa subsp. japonica TaxID=39947 RepID=Q7G5N7_ORYSJ|nr:retrotransposon protein, putative, Ty3-gypsy subclass [Oryza sativa Japonica Group]
MGSLSGIDDLVFPPGQSGENQVSAPFGIPNSAKICSKLISIESASNHSDEIQSTSTSPDQDDGAYPPILMKLPDDLAAVFTTKASSPRYLSSPGVDSRPTEIVEYDEFGYRYDNRDLDDFDESFEDNYTPLYFGIFMADNETEEQRQAREAEAQRVQQEAERRRLEEERQAQEQERLWREQQERERATKEAEDRRRRALDAGRRARDLIRQQDVEGTAVFRTPQQNAVAAITLLDNLLKEDALNQADHVVNILNQTKTMIAASVPVNSGSVRTPTGSRVPHLRSHDYHQPSLSIIGTGSSRRSGGHDERSVHSPPERHRERRVERPRFPPHQHPVDLRDTINQRRAARGHCHSPNRYDDDVDGVAAFTNDLRRVDWPAGFKPTGIEKYDGTTNPESWLTVYGLAIRAAGGDSKAMAKYLPGTFECPGTQFDLYNVVQKSGESLRDYIRRFSEQCNKISNITDDVIIAAFTKGIRHEDLVGKFGHKPPRTVKQMFEKANEYAKAEDAITVSKQSGTTWKPKKDTPAVGERGSNNHKDRKSKPEELVATTTPSSRQRSRINTFDKIMNSQCPHHPNSNHVAKDCFIYKKFAEQYAKNTCKPSDGDQGTSKKKDDEDDAPTGFQDSRKELNHIFGGPLAYESKRKQKLTEREINAVQTDTPQYLRWSEIEIKFDRSDHPDRVVHLGRYPREVIEHSLHVKEDAKPIKQRLRRFAQDRKDAIKEELTKLLAAGFIKEVLHPDWLADPVLVRKKTGQWRMCIDYTDLNKPCPKDPFGLPRIDQVVDSTASCELLSFLDCYSGYHQIRLKESDCLKTSFITPFGAYCYITMPFRLKNAGATYQRMIQRCFSTQIGRNVEAYVDDVVVKTKMKLNPEKCIFGVPSRKLLGFMVSQRGIQANPEKINAILNMKPPSSQKDVQKLTGCMAALSRFVSRLGERGMPFFKLLKKTDNFQWGPEAQKAFEDFKKLLTTPPVLASPHPQEPLLLYVSATSQVVSTVLVVEREEEGHIQKVQRPIYFVSEVLADSKTRYPQVQKLLYGVLITVKKLSHYFQGYSVTMVTSFPLGDILHNREANGRIEKWGLELMSLDISFKPRTSIKSQALADFLAEWTECHEDMPEEKMEYWTMHFDGSKRLTGTGAGVVLISPTGERLSYALLHGLRIAISLGIRRLIVRGDSQLVVNQVMKEWSCLDDNMTAYRQEVRKLEDKFDGLELTHVLRHNNEAADRLANFGSKWEAAPSDVFVEHLYEPTVPRKEAIEAMDTQGVSMIEADWREPLIKFLTKQELPQDKNEAEQISKRSRLYVIHETELYKKSPSRILQRCVSLEEGRQLLKDIHSGICGNHAAARTIVGKAYRQGFFWPIAVSDADKIVRTCKGCQSLPDKLTYQLRSCKPSRCRGRSRFGGSIWSVHSKRQSAVILISL